MSSEKHIMYRYLSEEDRIAIVPRQNRSIEITIPYENINDTKHSGGAPELKTLFKLLPTMSRGGSVRERLLKTIMKKNESDSKKTKKSDIKKLLDRNIDLLFKMIMEHLKLKIIVKADPVYYPITSANLKNKDVTVSEYLDAASSAYSGVRTTHGIHGMFTYKVTPKLTHPYYEDYGHWGTAAVRDTGGIDRKDMTKHLFVTTFKAGEKKGRFFGEGFNDTFTKLKNGKLEPIYIPCAGAGTNSIGDEGGRIMELGNVASCSEFDGIPVGDILKYARLGKLMPQRRPEEINFRGNGKIEGYLINMNDFEIVAEQIQIPKKSILVKIIKVFEKNMPKEIYKSIMSPEGVVSPDPYQVNFFRDVHDIILADLGARDDLDDLDNMDITSSSRKKRKGTHKRKKSKRKTKRKKKRKSKRNSKGKSKRKSNKKSKRKSKSG